MLRLHWLNLVAAYFDWTTPAVHLWGGTCEYTVLSCTWAALYVEHQEFRCNYFHLNKLINKCIVNYIEAALHCYFIHLQYTFTWHIYLHGQACVPGLFHYGRNNTAHRFIKHILLQNMTTVVILSIECLLLLCETMGLFKGYVYLKNSVNHNDATQKNNLSFYISDFARFMRSKKHPFLQFASLVPTAH